MKINDIFSHVNHRTHPIPNRKWKYYQEWNNVIFLHWKVDIKELKKFVPKELKIDTCQNTVWISLVAFTMENATFKSFPSFPSISNFNQINIRTYVIFNGKPGVYFLSIEAAKRISAKISAALSKMPYRYSKMNRYKHVFNSKNVTYNDKVSIDYTMTSPLENKSELDYWLTERYAVFHNIDGSIIEYDVHHIEWPIFSIQLNHISIDYDKFKMFFIDQPELYHYSPGVQVIAWDGIKHKLK